MLIKKVSYYDLNGNKSEDTLMFNLTNVEIARLSKKIAPEGENIQDWLTSVIQRGDNFELIDTIATLMTEAYGVKSEDGKRFIKNSALKEEFESSVSFAEYLEMVMLDEKEAIQFVSEVFNSERLKEATKNQVDILNNENAPVIPFNQPKTSASELAKASEPANTSGFSKEQIEQAIALLNQTND